ncbi:hypothetical protein JCM3770_006756 [Rhodotorula araucariae]
MAPAASTSSSLHLVPTRRATFHKSRKAAATKPLNWPYPLTGPAAKASSVHPDRLAEAGFFATPTRDDPTVTTCFLCDVVIGEWEDGEDPLYRHQAAADEAGIRCGWVTVQSEGWGPEGVDARPPEQWEALWGDDGELHPRGGRMGAAREHTFRIGWPHHGEEGIPTAAEIAAAGWYFRPGATEESADQCACLYCGRTVEGWEEGDDPVALHKRKVGLKCPFFLAPDLRDRSSAPSKSKKKPKASKAAPPPAEDADNVEEHEADSEPVKPKRGKKASATSIAAPSLKKSTRGRAKAPTVAEEPAASTVEVEQEDDDVPQSEPVKPARSKSRKASTSAAAGRKTAGRATRSKTTPAPSDAEEEMDVPVLKKSTRSRAASNASTTTSVAPPPRAAALSKSRLRTAKDVDLSAEVEARPQNTATLAKRGKTAPVIEREPEGDDTELEDDIAQLAAVADAALEAQPEPDPASAPAPYRVQEQAKPAREGKAKKASSASAASEGSGGNGKKADKLDPPTLQEGAEEKAPSPPLERALPASAVPPAVASSRAPLTPTVSPSAPRPIRSLPSKVHPSKSPSSTSVKAPTPTEPAPPLPLAAAPAPSSLPSSATAAQTPPLAVAVAAASNASTRVDPLAPWSPPPNPFASTSSLLSLLPPPTAGELDTLTVEGWYALCAARLEARFAAEAAAMRAELDARIAAGRARLARMCAEARERQERDERERRAAKKERKAAAALKRSAAAKAPAAAAAGVGSATRKMR